MICVICVLWRGHFLDYPQCSESQREEDEEEVVDGEEEEQEEPADSLQSSKRLLF